MADAKRLLDETGLSEPEEVLTLVESVFPGEPLGPRQRRWLEDVLDDHPRDPELSQRSHVRG